MNSNLFEKVTHFITKAKNHTDEKNLLCKIAQGIKNNEFKMHLQFIVDNRTKKIASAEALSRWETSDGQIVMPGKYIGLMEKSGIIVNFDYYMFEKVCEKLSKWQGTEFENITISCNFTRITISDKDFVSKIENIANKYVFDRSKLLIEITEDSIEKNLNVAMSNIVKIKQLGFCIALDDIGSGYTSFTSLCEYPIDVVKLDRDILLLADKNRGRKLFLGIVALLRNLDLKVVCEGVETQEQNALATEGDCDYIQGWYYSKALPENKAEDFAREYMKNF